MSATAAPVEDKLFLHNDIMVSLAAKQPVFHYLNRGAIKRCVFLNPGGHRANRYRQNEKHDEGCEA